MFVFFSGARSQSASVLTSLQEVKEVQDNLNEKEALLQDMEQQLASLKGIAERYEDTNYYYKIHIVLFNIKAELPSFPNCTVLRVCISRMLGLVCFPRIYGTYW